MVLTSLVRRMASRCASRSMLNALYLRLQPREQALCHLHFARIFRGWPDAVEDGEWLVDFAGRRVRLPLRQSHFALDWESALSILGHDVEVKKAYEDLLRGPRAPRVFFDIGANYGLHSVLFLAHGVRVISFEPNPACHDGFRALCAMNDVVGDLKAVALGECDGTCELWFEADETWDGTTDARRFAGRAGALVARVRRTTLDGFVRRSGIEPDLVKVDTEGSEPEVLRGGKATLSACHPRVIFESWTNGRREEVFDLLEESGYRISSLPLGAARPLNRAGFLKSPAFNFMANAA